jgi:uncharacterized membrane protein YoaK (UPF0700 family)
MTEVFRRNDVSRRPTGRIRSAMPDFIYTVSSRYWKWLFFAVLIFPFGAGLIVGEFLSGWPSAVHFAAILGTLLAWLKTRERESAHGSQSPRAGDD